MPRQSAHNRLNAKQLRTLRLIYRFRFVTAPLLAKYKHTSHQSSHHSLKTLQSQGSIAKRFTKDYKLLGKAAKYYLSTNGLKELRSRDGIDEVIFHAMYRNPTISEVFMDRCLQAMELYIKLEQDYPDQFETYTRVETTHVDGFFEPTPDLYLKSITRDKPGYFLELQAGSQPFVLRKRIQEYIEHYDSGDWENGDYPGILVACDTPQSERATQEFIAKVLESTGIDDEMMFLTTSSKAVANQTRQLWTNPLNPNQLLEL